jgi:hypothetical protein
MKVNCEDLLLIFIPNPKSLSSFDHMQQFNVVARLWNWAQRDVSYSTKQNFKADVALFERVRSNPALRMALHLRVEN